MDQLESIRTFHEVVNSGSISGAARKLSVSDVVLSRQIRWLEKRLGVYLFSRETRAVSLTDVGRRYFDRTLELVCSLDDCERSIANMVHKPMGTLRIVAPNFFSHYGLAQCLHQYNVTYPDVRLELTLVDRPINLVHDGYDLGLVDTSLLPHCPTSLIARPIMSEPLIACASPEYLRRRGIPEHPDQLVEHAHVALTAQPSGSREWLLEGPDGTRHTLDQRPTMVVDNIDALIQMLISGAGIGFAPATLVRQDIQNGKLLEVLPEYSTAIFSVSIVYPSREHMPAKVRTFIDHLLRTVGEPAHAPVPRHLATGPDPVRKPDARMERASADTAGRLAAAAA
ncbi:MULTISPECIES: LysR family transcriptional regulator [Burkholderia]|uniref:LysR family transcriptional regulator n=1 Tax=Burkholderia paludis TaxID=1506587 RepID=A0A6J5F5M2_9BURK|nr:MULTISPECIES: LysR family transcriptional regulator [Burkholderia]CAB3773794.1 HTH-type transcriptional regulator DmlR [Burkholderia paludis]VWB47186.1 LysR family transcriptional regulator [Burkholderia paludis]